MTTLLLVAVGGILALKYLPGLLSTTTTPTTLSTNAVTAQQQAAAQQTQVQNAMLASLLNLTAQSAAAASKPLTASGKAAATPPAGVGSLPSSYGKTQTGQSTSAYDSASDPIVAAEKDFLNMTEGQYDAKYGDGAYASMLADYEKLYPDPSSSMTDTGGADVTASLGGLLSPDFNWEETNRQLTPPAADGSGGAGDASGSSSIISSLDAIPISEQSFLDSQSVDILAYEATLEQLAEPSQSDGYASLDD